MRSFNCLNADVVRDGDECPFDLIQQLEAGGQATANLDATQVIVDLFLGNQLYFNCAIDE